MSDLEFERDGHVAVLTMNRPQRRNALSLEMVGQFAQAWDEIDGDDRIRVAVLTGAGEYYCSGGDLSEGWMMRDGSRVDVGKGLLLEHTLAKPLIAAVNGPCLGGGCEMLQQTDIRIAERRATFGLPEAKVGLIAGAGSTVRLKRQIPYTKAMEMILTGDPLSAREAYDFGLVGHVVENGESLDRARKIAERVAANGPLAVRAAKAAVIASGWLDEETARRIERRLVTPVVASADAKEGVAAFKEKRKPRFEGR
ncbi:enoyl-CoA hydratase [Amycolatopsis acidicola]|uniref:Enoyl-CoA hydratase n=1 Tax=Amycolatopsis acidicola TaxID=2596893 RepID=A0A5N0UY10_9PSEU|nr:enoyl-CoA hydratase-related protein [Amycolatopsis acidicola]KAA9156353.1 enoyl-CoA hydratase [Amycolatopsis acidicola]